MSGLISIISGILLIVGNFLIEDIVTEQVGDFGSTVVLFLALAAGMWLVITGIGKLAQGGRN